MKDKKIVYFVSGVILGAIILTGGYLLNNNSQVGSTKISYVTNKSLNSALRDNNGLWKMIDDLDYDILMDKYQNDEEVKAEVDIVIEQIKQAQVGDFSQFLKNNNFDNEEDLKNAIMIDTVYAKLKRQYAESFITDETINNYYASMGNDIRTKQIFIKSYISEDTSEIEQMTNKVEALKKANDIIQKLNNGESFDSLAKQYSDDDTTKNNGGDSGFFNKGLKALEYDAAAFKLKNGEYTKTPVETAGGYFIILKVEERAKDSLENMKEIIKNALFEKYMNEENIYDKVLIKLRKEYNFKINDKKMQKLYDEYVKEITGE